MSARTSNAPQDAAPRGASASAPEPLKRELSRLAIAVLAINGVVGAGIFGLPADAARLLGAFSPIVFVACGLAMSAIMLSFAQAASYFGSTGGPIVYTQAAFGPFVGFQTGWVLYVSRTASLAANANLFATYLGTYVEGAGEGVLRVVVIALLCASFAALNIAGVKQGIGALMAITVVKFIPLAIFVALGLAYVRPAAFAGATLPSSENFGSAALLVLYAFIGFEGALVPAGESRRPQHDIPRAMIAIAIFVMLLYVLIQTVSVAVLPDLAQAPRPLAAAAGVMMGSAGVTLISIGALVSVAGNFAASVLSAPRMTYALAREGSLPRWFGAVHERYKTPHVSIVAYCAIGCALGAAGSFAGLAVMSSLARLLCYLASIAALPRLRQRFGAQPSALRLPGGLTIPFVAFATCVWLVAQVSFEAVWKTALLIAAGAVLYALARRGGTRAGA